MAMANVDPEAGAAEEPLLDPPPQRPYPDPCYCPLTNEVMRDPVVGPDGNSFEKSVVTECDAAAGDLERTYYPNRALRAIIEREKHRVEEQDTLRGALERAEESVHAGFQQVLEKCVLPTREHRALPDAYYCSITLDIISRAAIDPDGHSYERQAILGWIQANGDSPITREALDAGQLRDNHALDDLIDEEVNKPDGVIHPSFRRWRESRLEYRDDGDSQESKTEGEGPQPFPTSQEEIEQLSTGKWKCTCSAFLFLIAVLFFAIGLVPLEILFFIWGGLLWIIFHLERAAS